MRKLVVLFASLVILLVVFGALGFGQEKYTPKPNEEIYGTWVNEQINPQKTVINPDGSFEDYFPASYSKPFRGGTTEIFKKWTDSEGSVYYDTFDTFTSGMGIQGMKTQCLKKVSKSGTVLVELGCSKRIWTRKIPFNARYEKRTRHSGLLYLLPREGIGKTCSCQRLGFQRGAAGGPSSKLPCR